MTDEELKRIETDLKHAWNNGSLFVKVAEEHAPALLEEVKKLKKEIERLNSLISS